MSLVGICGLARCGKDSFYDLSKTILDEKKQNNMRLAFADALKEELDELLLKNTGISAFTNNDNDKQIIRPLLVTYGTHVRRKLDKNCWIKRLDLAVKYALERDLWVFITDVRYKNEIEWLHELGGKSVHITRTGNEAPNKEEVENDPILKSESDFLIEWNDFNKENTEEISNKVKDVLQSIR